MTFLSIFAKTALSINKPFDYETNFPFSFYPDPTLCFV